MNEFEALRNIKSNKIFILIEVLDEIMVKLICPDGIIRDLKCNLFEENILFVAENELTEEQSKAKVDYDTKELIKASVDERNKENMREGNNIDHIKYHHNRLAFIKRFIDRVSATGKFTVITPVGNFTFMKSEFLEMNIANTHSYLNIGIYHYPKIPSWAFDYLDR